MASALQPSPAAPEPFGSLPPGPAASPAPSRDLASQAPASPGPASTASLAPPAPAIPPPAATAEPAPDQSDASVAKAPGGVPSSPDAPTACLPAGLRSVLADVGARFGAVTVVSTTHLHTDNHSRGSVRAKMHEACKAVDFKVAGASQPVLAYLKTRAEVNGINLYKNNGVIHIDASGSEKTARTTSKDDEVATSPPARTAVKPATTAKTAPAKKPARQVARRSAPSSGASSPLSEYEKAFDPQGNSRAEPAPTE